MTTKKTTFQLQNIMFLVFTSLFLPSNFLLAIQIQPINMDQIFYFHDHESGQTQAEEFSFIEYFEEELQLIYGENKDPFLQEWAIAIILLNLISNYENSPLELKNFVATINAEWEKYIIKDVSAIDPNTEISVNKSSKTLINMKTFLGDLKSLVWKDGELRFQKNISKETNFITNAKEFYLPFVDLLKNGGDLNNINLFKGLALLINHKNNNFSENEINFLQEISKINPPVILDLNIEGFEELSTNIKRASHFYFKINGTTAQSFVETFGKELAIIYNEHSKDHIPFLKEMAIAMIFCKLILATQNNSQTPQNNFKTFIVQINNAWNNIITKQYSPIDPNAKIKTFNGATRDWKDSTLTTQSFFDDLKSVSKNRRNQSVRINISDDDGFVENIKNFYLPIIQLLEKNQNITTIPFFNSLRRWIREGLPLDNKNVYPLPRERDLLKKITEIAEQKESAPKVENFSYFQTEASAFLEKFQKHQILQFDKNKQEAYDAILSSEDIERQKLVSDWQNLAQQNTLTGKKYAPLHVNEETQRGALDVTEAQARQKLEFESRQEHKNIQQQNLLSGEQAAREELLRKDQERQNLLRNLTVEKEQIQRQAIEKDLQTFQQDYTRQRQELDLKHHQKQLEQQASKHQAETDSLLWQQHEDRITDELNRLQKAPEEIGPRLSSPRRPVAAETKILEPKFLNPTVWPGVEEVKKLLEQQD